MWIMRKKKDRNIVKHEKRKITTAEEHFVKAQSCLFTVKIPRNYNTLQESYYIKYGVFSIVLLLGKVFYALKEYKKALEYLHMYLKKSMDKKILLQSQRVII